MYLTCGWEVFVRLLKYDAHHAGSRKSVVASCSIKTQELEAVSCYAIQNFAFRVKASSASYMLSRDGVIIDGFCIGDRIYYTLWCSLWLHSTTITDTIVFTVTFPCQSLVAASNGGGSTSSVLPNYPWSYLPASHSSSSQLNCSSLTNSPINPPLTPAHNLSCL
jgi:hypothetical protein